MNRLYNLGYLRGLAAFAIMIYHYLTWTLGEFSADQLMGRIGIYGVSLFYVLSGLTLFHVYQTKMRPSRREIIAFFKRRIFRIFPLLWLATITAIVLSRQVPDYFDLFLNLTGLFGFVKWDTYFSTGVWSVGNELVFYVLFPFFVFVALKGRKFLIIPGLVLFLVFIYFAFVRLNPELSIYQQWRNYVNPFNQAFLFFGGFLTGVLFNNAKVNKVIVTALLILGAGPFIFIFAEGDKISLVTGTNRLIFTACCFLICFSFYKLTFKFPSFIHKPLTLLGEASYSVYLLHPLIYTITGIASKYLINYPESVRLILSVILTLAASYFTYEYFEKFFMKLGRRTGRVSDFSAGW